MLAAKDVVHGMFPLLLRLAHYIALNLNQQLIIVLFYAAGSPSRMHTGIVIIVSIIVIIVLIIVLLYAAGSPSRMHTGEHTHCARARSLFKLLLERRCHACHAGLVVRTQRARLLQRVRLLRRLLRCRCLLPP